MRAVEGNLGHSPKETWRKDAEWENTHVWPSLDFTDTSLRRSMMQSEVTMPAQARRRYTEEFKMEAVRLVRASAHPVAPVARDLGIPDHVWYRWRAPHRQAEVHGTTRV